MVGATSTAPGDGVPRGAACSPAQPPVTTSGTASSSGPPWLPRRLASTGLNGSRNWWPDAATRRSSPVRGWSRCQPRWAAWSVGTPGTARRASTSATPGVARASAATRASVSSASPTVRVGDRAVPVAAGRMGILTTDPAADGVVLRAAEPSRVLLIAGAPLREPIVQYGPFVMNNRAEIRQAIDDAAAGRLGAISPRNLGAREEIQ